MSQLGMSHESDRSKCALRNGRRCGIVSSVSQRFLRFAALCHSFPQPRVGGGEMFSPSRPGPWIQSHQRSPLSIICKKSASMSRAAIFYLVGLLAVGGCREDTVVAPRVRVPSGALADGSVSGPRVASGYVAVDLGVLLPNLHSYAHAINNYRQIVITDRKRHV